MVDQTHLLGAPFELWVHLFEKGSITEIEEEFVTISADARVADLRQAIIPAFANLEGRKPGELVVRPTHGGEPLLALRTRLSAVKFLCEDDGSLHAYVEVPPKLEARGSKRAKWVEPKKFSRKYDLQDLPLPSPDTLRFVAPPNWLSNLVGEVKAEMQVQDSKERCTMPVALTRCSRGGKTRALEELARALRHEGIPVILITFNDYSTLSKGSDEQSDPLNALLIRIAFVAMNEPPYPSFSTFRTHYAVSPEEIHDWLGNSPCVLLLDEVNRLDALESTDEDKMALISQFWDFVREEFLAPQGRMLVFSSHIATTMLKVQDYFQASMSGRMVIPYPLPLLPNWEAAKALFTKNKKRHLTAEAALYRGLIPALMVSHTAPPLPAFPLEPINVRTLLSTFLTGDVKGVDEFLLPFFDVSVQERRLDDWRMFTTRVNWIMHFMNSIIHELAKQFKRTWQDKELELSMRTLYTPLDHFTPAKTLSGDAFENLFAFTFLLRAFVGDLFPAFFNELGFAGPCSISINHVLESGNLEDCQKLPVLHAMVAIPDCVSFPHVAYYLPPHPSFNTYDAFAYIYDDQKKLVRILGFRLKRGRAYPTCGAESHLAGFSFIIRGKTSSLGSDIETPAGWRPFSREEVTVFFGVSGRQWVPAQLDELLFSS